MTLTTNSQQKIYAIIPARAGSKRIKDKNLQEIGGKSLIQWSIEAAQRCKGIELVVVSTDSEEYARHAESLGALALLRPPELASDTATDEDVLIHFYQHYPCDMCVFLRPTTPFRNEYFIEIAIQKMLAYRGRADSLRSVEEMVESAYKCFQIREGELKPIGCFMQVANLPNQLVAKTYRGNGYVDILFGPKWGERILSFITPRTIEIDTEDDLEYARWAWNMKGKGVIL